MSWKWRHKPPTETTIQQVAHELYRNRVLLNRPGSAADDWATAEKIVHSPLKTTLFASHRPLIKLEKQVWEPLLAWADNQALLSLLGIIGNAGIILALITYIATEKQRCDAEVLNAWQTLTSAHGQSGSGGRIQALEFLNASPGANWRRRVGCLWVCTWPRESLDGIKLGVEPLGDVPASPLRQDTDESEENSERKPYRDTPAVYLVNIQLPQASLQNANLAGADLLNANLAGADLLNANLAGAYLASVNLAGANLASVNLAGADLRVSNLAEADLGYTNLAGTILWAANLAGADLRGSNLKDANMSYANLAGAVDITEQTLSRALLCKTVLPDDITLDPNRNCEEMGIEP